MSEQNEHIEDVELEEQDNEEQEEENPEQPKKEEQEKPKETPEARKARLERQLKRVNKELGLEPKEEPKKETSAQKGELDYGQKAFLVANGIKGKEELALVQEVMEESGKSLEDVLESKYFQSELKELRDDKATAKATPTGTQRSKTSARDSVDYWLAKGELPPTDNQELRRKVVNARIAQEKSANRFSDNAVVHGSGVEIR